MGRMAEEIGAERLNNVGDLEEEVKVSKGSAVMSDLTQVASGNQTSSVNTLPQLSSVVFFQWCLATVLFGAMGSIQGK